MRDGATFGILFNEAVRSAGFRRFTIGHELGHYCMPHHHGPLFADGPWHISASGFVSNRWHELEADHFSAALLMPEQQFAASLGHKTPRLATVERIARKFQTSLTSTAIRVAKLSPAPVATLVSQGGRVMYCWVSEALSDVPGVGRMPIGPGDPLPKSATLALSSNPERVGSADRTTDDCPSTRWFPEVCEAFSLREEVVGLGPYGRALTILSADEVPDPDDYDPTPKRNLHRDDPWSAGWGDAQIDQPSPF